MKSLEVTDEQYAFVQKLREEISEQVVGKYGYVRERDAVQFLIDNLDGDLEIDNEFDADGVAPDVEAAVSFDETQPEFEPDEDETDAADEPADGAEQGTETAAEPGEDANDEDGDDEPADEDDQSADDDDMLNEMMSLLETHDDKWEESSSSDYRYSVELPDGTTEEVQTKDDVRALLFKNYR